MKRNLIQFTNQTRARSIYTKIWARKNINFIQDLLELQGVISFLMKNSNYFFCSIIKSFQRSLTVSLTDTHDMEKQSSLVNVNTTTSYSQSVYLTNGLGKMRRLQLSWVATEITNLEKVHWASIYFSLCRLKS